MSAAAMEPICSEPGEQPATPPCSVCNPYPEFQGGQRVTVALLHAHTEGWESVEHVGTVLDPCVNDPDHAGTVKVQIDGDESPSYLSPKAIEPVKQWTASIPAEWALGAWLVPELGKAYHLINVALFERRPNLETEEHRILKALLEALEDADIEIGKELGEQRCGDGGTTFIERETSRG